MYFLLYLTFTGLYEIAKAENDTLDHFDNVTTTVDNERIINPSVSDIANAIISVFDDSIKENKRIQDMREKLKKIESYIIDKDKYAELLITEATGSNLTEINFFHALNENDHFRLRSQNDSKNLYLKLKEKMNRDDVMKIIADKGVKKQVVKAARRMMSDDYVGKSRNQIVDGVVDKVIAETPKDNHKYDAKDNESIYWDPQTELEELRDYHQHDGRRLFRGERTTVRYYPFVVSISIMSRFWCGGSIYWHDLVLTSASCLQLMHNNRFFRENPKVLEIRIGSNHSRIGGEVVNALEVFFHPSYNPRTLQSNIAVIRLRRSLYFNYHRIPKIIPISHSPDLVPATAEVMLLGWGVTKTSQKLSFEPIFLQRKFLPVYPNTFCKEVYGEKFITNKMFCAGTMTTGEGACDHDAGGPAILAGKLVGIISFGPATCGFPNAPTVFTLVGAFADWIESVNESIPSYHRGLKRTTTKTPSPLIDYFKTYSPRGGGKSSKNTGALVIHTTETPREPAPTPAPTPADKAPARQALRLAEDTDANDGWSIDLKK